jgi:3-isopropylmalate dehydratase small subunit
MGSKLDHAIRGRVWKFGDSIDTNQLAGLSDAQSMEACKAECLVGLRPEFPSQVRSGDIIVAGGNFGAGSSRQSAVEVLDYLGIQAVLAESVARIYFRTAMALAFPVFIAAGIQKIVEDGEEIEIHYRAGLAKNPQTGAMVDLTKYPPSVERIFEVGGLANLIAQRLGEQGVKPSQTRETPV